MLQEEALQEEVLLQDVLLQEVLQEEVLQEDVLQEEVPSTQQKLIPLRRSKLSGSYLCAQAASGQVGPMAGIARSRRTICSPRRTSENLVLRTSSLRLARRIQNIKTPEI